jgi:ABC-type dipeptide/oligopeptide/nickel transport system ATPase subunit
MHRIPAETNRLLIIGPTGVGKTTLAGLLAEKHNVCSVSASIWVRNMFPGQQRDVLTQKSISMAETDPLCGIQDIESVNAKIIEGIRNPFHFTHLVGDKNFQTYIVRLKYTRCGVDDYFSDFEQEGIEAIDAIIKWQKFPKNRYSEFCMSDYDADDYNEEWKQCLDHLVFV